MYYELSLKRFIFPRSPMVAHVAHSMGNQQVYYKRRRDVAGTNQMSSGRGYPHFLLGRETSQEAPGWYTRGELWSVAREGCFHSFLFFTLVTSILDMEGMKDGLSFKGVAERLTLGITRVLGMYNAQLAS